MRTIKFRAWHTKKLFMCEWMETLDGEWYFIKRTGKWGDNSTSIHDECFEWNCEDLIRMQFTGLLDKNGVEIYEGDIVKFRSHPDKQIFGWVEYFPNECRFCVLYYRDDFDKERKQISYYSFLHYNTLESIGNIYQNPNLIK